MIRKFLISFQEYPNGDVSVSYNKNGELVSICVAAAQMAGNAAQWMFRRFPLSLEEFKTTAETKGWRVSEVCLEVTFAQWWNLYDKKVNKARCLPLWNKLSTIKQIDVYYNTQDYLYYLDAEKWRTKADPETYLRKEFYNNEWKKLLTSCKK